MKTVKNLFQHIVSFENLVSAAHKAAKGKREQPNVMRFFAHLEENLWRMRQELITRTYQPGCYTTFEIYHPKPRLISAAPFHDRVVHHALINVIGPLVERAFVHDSYANQVDKGTHRAIRRYQFFLRRFKYVLKCDIKKYFPSIDHEILKGLFRRKIGDGRALWLMDLIVDCSNTQVFVGDYFPRDDVYTPANRRKGLPIGNLTSQFFANWYLTPLDHFIKERLRCKGYLRYVDDFVLFDDGKTQLRQWEHRIEAFLIDYRLKLQPRRVQLYPATERMRFLGQVVGRNRRRLPGENVRRFRRRLRRWQNNPPENLQQRIASWMGHARQAHTQALVKKINETMMTELDSTREKR